ncbi:MAG: 30S ribosomal protein S18 [Chloroflexi bacterium RBG_16_64_32]|nr:MAG: 30S ribosomal protein S18 [Chloroflexi bacterium RBG_16_64_32]
MPGADYKDFNFLRRFVSDRGRIESRRKSGACAKHQRSVARAIKRARHLALIPYTADHIRSSGVSPSR